MKTIKRALCLMAFLCGLAALVPAFADDTHSHPVDGTDVVFTALAPDTVQLSQSGSYYLDEDLTLSGTLTVTGENVVVDLCLNGRMLTNSTNSVVINVTDGATLNLCDCYDPAIHMGAQYEHTFRDPADIRYDKTVEGGFVGGVKASGIRVSGGGALNLYGGTIAGCSPSGQGGGIFLQKGDLSIHDGVVIRDNVAGSNGGGICAQAGTKAAPLHIRMIGGEITGNSAKAAGGGIYLGTYVEMELSGGRIDGNRQTAESTMANYGGGGAHLAVYSRLRMSGGSIAGNTAASNCGGVMLNTLAEIQLSGSPVIAGNTAADADSDLCVVYKAGAAQGSVLVNGALAPDARIGLSYTRPSLDGPVTLVTAAVEYHGGAVSGEDFSRFFTNVPTRSLLWSEAKRIEVCTGRVHAICGSNCTHGADGTAIHEQVVFQPLDTTFNGGTLKAGNYYLTDDVALTEPVVISGGTVALCLNGHEICNASGRVFQIGPGGKLSLCDCYASETHPGEEFIHTYKNPQTKVDVVVQGGLISGYHSLTSRSGGIEVNGGTLEFYGGTIGGASGSGGVRLTNGARLDMYGGAVNDCLSNDSGGGIYADGTSIVRIAGGRVLSNRAREQGGGVFAENGFRLSGEVWIIGNTVGAQENNVYLPQGTLIAVTGPVNGMIGISMERQGIFTSGGAAPYVYSFRADSAEGTFAEVAGRELTLSGFGVRTQPSPETRTVIMRSPENVVSYQWYALEYQTLTDADVTNTRCGYDPASGLWSYTFAEESDSFDCFTVALHEGDTVRVSSDAGMDSLSLMMPLETEDGTVLVTSAYSAIPDETGAYFVTATEPGTYTLCVGRDGLWQPGDVFLGGISLFRCGDAVAHQTGPTYTGPSGYYTCKVEYNDNATVIYSEPLAAGEHQHPLCGADCAHTPAHEIVTFMPMANTLDGEVLLGENLNETNILTTGSYYLAGDVTLTERLTVPAGQTVTLCLHGHSISSEISGVFSVAPGAVLNLCDCVSGGSITGHSDTHGGGLMVEGSAVLYAGVITESSASDRGAGVYLARDGCLTLAGDVRLTENAAEDIYLSTGCVVQLAAPLPENVKFGVSMETLGVFTVGAAQGDESHFYAYGKGTFVVVGETGELALEACSILSQPTAEVPTLTVSHAEGVTYQWYTAEPSSVENGTGSGFTVTLAQGQLLRVTVRGTLSEDTAEILLNGQPMPLGADGAYCVTVDVSDIYTVTASPELQITGTVYTVTDAVEGDNRQTLETETPGAYVCRAVWPDGMELQSNVLIFPEPEKDPVIPIPDPAVKKPPVTSPFADVSTEAWYFDSVLAAYDNGWMLGMTESEFSPETPVTRAMLVATLWRMAGSPPAAVHMPFADVPADAYYTSAVRWAVEKGIACGMDETLFCPEQLVTREQTAAFLYRFAAVDGCVTSVPDPAKLENFTDPPAPWAAEAVCWALEAGVLHGMDNGRLEPAGSTTRAQLAVLLTQYGAEYK